MCAILFFYYSTAVFIQLARIIQLSTLILYLFCYNLFIIRMTSD